MVPVLSVTGMVKGDQWVLIKAEHPAEEVGATCPTMHCADFLKLLFELTLGEAFHASRGSEFADRRSGITLLGDKTHTLPLHLLHSVINMYAIVNSKDFCFAQ